MGSHLLKLENAGYVSVKKTFVHRKPVTTYRMTERGRSAFARYIQNLKKILGEQLD
jgi:DNA-binding PadR family transcriptional regulator